jgi:hypothetical protein
VNDGPTGKGTDGEQGGVFGNLPKSRPGPRSPRRTADGATKPKQGAKQRTQRPLPKRAARPRPKAPAPPSPRPAAARHEAPQPPESSSGAGLEDIAWAGVAVAAEAATIGVRLASRAIDALRGSTERD